MFTTTYILARRLDVKCPVCSRRISHGKRSVHHFWHPKSRYAGTAKEHDVRVIHVKCHKEYNIFFYRYCWGKPKDCRRCRFTGICCYYTQQ